MPLSTSVYILPSFSFDQKKFSLPLTLTDSGTSVIPVLLWLDIGEPGHFKLIINIFYVGHRKTLSFNPAFLVANPENGFLRG